jgi:HK97 family phage prohead protease
MPAPKSEGRERRALTLPIEVREIAKGDGEGRTVRGYAAIFNSETDIGGYWREKIAQGAFTETLKTADVLALYSHRTDRVVGRSTAGTLRLQEDEKGLAVEIDLPDTTDGRDLAVLIERGDVNGMSFGFVTRKQEWDETVDPPLRTILEVDLYEVTITAFPAYPDTEIGLRSLEHLRNERREHNQAGALGRISARRARQAQAERGIR